MSDWGRERKTRARAITVTKFFRLDFWYYGERLDSNSSLSAKVLGLRPNFCQSRILDLLRARKTLARSIAVALLGRIGGSTTNT